MESIKHRWKSLPNKIRKPIILTIGMIFVIASPFTGVLPGPGGIPVFLIGVAILATEFEWAARLRDQVLDWVHRAGKQYRRHKVLGTILITIAVASAIALSVLTYRYFR